jgi:hypothetical protein
MAVITWLRFKKRWDHFVRTSAGLIVSPRGKLGLDGAAPVVDDSGLHAQRLAAAAVEIGRVADGNRQLDPAGLRDRVGQRLVIVGYDNAITQDRNFGVLVTGGDVLFNPGVGLLEAGQADKIGAVRRRLDTASNCCLVLSLGPATL